ncbi:MAG: isoprenylcysteine carboxylmethyltransferase family protein [Phycisphaerae bacterium]|nr:isoprenylcysteine carboxylmethyltransferase family protein [Phycisphaerae bacterium]
MKVIYKLRGLLMAPLMIFVTLCTWGETDNDLLAWGIGGATFAVGLALRVWAQVHLRYRLKVRKTLTTTGPYACVRNPSYIGNTIILSGVCMLTGMFWFVPVQLVYCAAVYSLVVRYEEAYLATTFGAPYLEYCSAVPRWFPRWRALQTRADMGSYLIPSLLAEAHNLLYLLLFAVKELAVR